MKVVGLKALDKFKKKHGDCRRQIDEWTKAVKAAKWESFADIKQTFPSASFLTDKKVIFNIKGNQYRLFTVIIIIDNTLYVKWIGTHAEYDKISF